MIPLSKTLRSLIILIELLMGHISLSRGNPAEHPPVQRICPVWPRCRCNLNNILLAITARHRTVSTTGRPGNQSATFLSFFGK